MNVAKFSGGGGWAAKLLWTFHPGWSGATELLPVKKPEFSTTQSYHLNKVHLYIFPIGWFAFSLWFSCSLQNQILSR